MAAPNQTLTATQPSMHQVFAFYILRQLDSTWNASDVPTLAVQLRHLKHGRPTTAY